MQIDIIDRTGDTYTMLVDEVEGINCLLRITGEFEPEQLYKPPSMNDPFGQQGFPAQFTVCDVEAMVTPEWAEAIPESAVEDELDEAGFYKKVIDEILEY